jgi:hypothetical protein
MQTITALVFVLPPVCMFLTMIARDIAFVFGIVWLAVSFAGLAWGVYLRGRHRVWSWLCIVYAIVQFGLLALPFILPASYGGPG